MRRLKKGDVVKCIDVKKLITGPNGILTLGKNYEILKEEYDDDLTEPINIIYVINDLGYIDHYRMDRFEEVSEIRRKIIEEILR